MPTRAATRSDHNRFLAIVASLRHDLADDIDPAVARGFAEAAHREGLLHQFDGLIDEMGRQRNVPESLRVTVRTLTGRMRNPLGQPIF